MPPAKRKEPHPSGRILRYDKQSGGWEGVAAEAYKTEAGDWSDIRRFSLLGMHGESTRFHLRYFEIAPGGHSSCERHRHEHVVIAFRGRGEIWLDGVWQRLEPGDIAYTAPLGVHQLRARGRAPFGFFCLVDAERDRPEVLDQPGSASSCELPASRTRPPARNKTRGGTQT